MPILPPSSALSGNSAGLIVKSAPPRYLARIPFGARQMALDPFRWCVSGMTVPEWGQTPSFRY